VNYLPERIFFALVRQMIAVVRFWSLLDSPLEGRVSSEPVSEWAFSGLANYGLILRCLWMIPEA